MKDQAKRVRIGDYEFIAAEPPPPTNRGRGAVKLAATALRAMNELGVDSVLVLCDAATSFAGSQNKHAEAEGIPVKFLAQNPHVDREGRKRVDVYAVRSVEVGS